MRSRNARYASRDLHVRAWCARAEQAGGGSAQTQNGHAAVEACCLFFLHGLGRRGIRDVWMAESARAPPQLLCVGTGGAKCHLRYSMWGEEEGIGGARSRPTWRREERETRFCVLAAHGNV
eukprot:364844-Chlamydomonas_euryale.AAC.6